MKRRKVLMSLGVLVLIAMSIAFLMPMAADAAEKIKWKLSFFAGPPNDQIGNALEWWAKEVTKRSNGEMEVECFWFGSLAPGGQEFDGLKSGLFQVADFIPAYNPSKLPLMNLEFLPCLIPLTSDTAEGFATFEKIKNEWLRNPVLTEELAKWDAVLLFTAASPEYYRLIGNVPVTSIDDLKGKKIRAVSGIGDLFRKVGATPVATTGPEMYDALSKGVVELVCHAPSLFTNTKLHEVSKYYIPTINLGHMGGTPVMSKTAYAKLPEHLKKIVQDVSREAFDVHIKFWVDAMGGFLQKIKDRGLQEVKFSADSQQKLREMSKEVIWKDAVDKLEKQGLKGKEAFNSFQDAIKKFIPGFDPSYL